jgi:hypothetical protein
MGRMNGATCHPEHGPLTWRNVVNQNIGGLEEFIQLRPIRRDAEVKADTAFVRIEIMEKTAGVGVGVIADERASRAHVVTLRRFDFDYLSAQEGHQFRRKRSGNTVATLHDTKIGQRQMFHRFPSAIYMIKYWHTGFLMSAFQAYSLLL